MSGQLDSLGVSLDFVDTAAVNKQVAGGEEIGKGLNAPVKKLRDLQMKGHTIQLAHQLPIYNNRQSKVASTQSSQVEIVRAVSLHVLAVHSPHDHIFIHNPKRVDNRELVVDHCCRNDTAEFDLTKLRLN